MPSAPPASTHPPADRHFHTLALSACLLGAAAWLAAILRAPHFADAFWPVPLFLLLALAATLASLTRTLPLQNVLAATALIFLISAVIQFLGVQTSIPFGPRTFTGGFGPELLGVPCLLPVFWTVAILTSRGVARLILRPWRKLHNYGLWTIGLTCLLTVALDLALEPFATAAHSHWIWRTTHPTADWPAAPVINFLAWALGALLILIVITPWLINKATSKQSFTDYHPLILWLLLALLPAADTAAHHLWLPAALNLAAAATVTTFALRGARW
jgi:uncharacterized membrane protein